MTSEDPISGREYEQSIEGIKRWAAHELPYGVPLLYALVGFAVITTLIYSLVSAAAWVLSWTVPAWVPVVICVLGIIWAFGGWQHGEEAESELELDTDDQFDNVTP
jgi:hypothetical protein